MRDQLPDSSLPTHPAPRPTPERLACGRGDCQVEEDLVLLRWRHRFALHRFPTGQAPHAPPVPQLRLQKFGRGERPDPTWHFARRSVARTRPSLPPLAGGWGRGGRGWHVGKPHTAQPKPTAFPLHFQRPGGEARLPLHLPARQGHAVDAQGRVQVRPVRLPVRREGEGRPQGLSGGGGGVEHPNQTNARGDSGPEPFWQRLDSPS